MEGSFVFLIINNKLYRINTDVDKDDSTGKDEIKKDGIFITPIYKHTLFRLIDIDEKTQSVSIQPVDSFDKPTYQNPYRPTPGEVPIMKRGEPTGPIKKVSIDYLNKRPSSELKSSSKPTDIWSLETPSSVLKSSRTPIDLSKLTCFQKGGKRTKRKRTKRKSRRN
jgi:hypothetical protein